MSTAPAATPPTAIPAAPAPAKAARPDLIKRTADAAESPGARLLKKQLPAIVVSGAVHVALIVALITADAVVAKPAAEGPSDALLTVVAPEEKDPTKENLTNPDIGIAADIPSAIEAEKLADVNVADAVQPKDNPGLADSAQKATEDVTAPAGVGVMTDKAGAAGTLGDAMAGGGSAGSGEPTTALGGRGAATRSNLVAMNGGNSASEAAVARGMVWLAKQQKANGSWVYDGTSKDDTASATAMALLPFLAAGQTHKSTADDNKYKANVEAGVRYLLSVQKHDGSFKAGEGYYMYSHAICTVALCELLGMSNDQTLVTPCQLAVNYIVKAQAPNGSWGYQSGTQGDTSIVGWQVQALHAAALCKSLKVDRRASDRARKFLDTVAAGPHMSQYGYTSPQTGQGSLTAVGLLSRYYVSDWGPQQPGMVAGVKFLAEKHPPTQAKTDLYYFYYATQVLHFFEGDEWVSWNAKMRDRLLNSQVKGAPDRAGSWNPDDDKVGSHCGRLGTTCLSLLTLEVYYRHLSLTKRGTGGLKELQRGL